MNRFLTGLCLVVWALLLLAAHLTTTVLWWAADMLSWPWRAARAFTHDRVAAQYEETADHFRGLRMDAAAAQMDHAARRRREHAALCRRRPG